MEARALEHLADGSAHTCFMVLDLPVGITRRAASLGTRGVLSHVRRVLHEDGAGWVLATDRYTHPDRHRPGDLAGFTALVQTELARAKLHLRAQVCIGPAGAARRVPDRPWQSHSLLSLVSRRQRYVYDAIPSVPSSVPNPLALSLYRRTALRCPTHASMWTWPGDKALDPWIVAHCAMLTASRPVCYGCGKPYRRRAVPRTDPMQTQRHELVAACDCGLLCQRARVFVAQVEPMAVAALEALGLRVVGDVDLGVLPSIDGDVFRLSEDERQRRLAL